MPKAAAQPAAADVAGPCENIRLHSPRLILTFLPEKRYFMQSYGGDKRRDGPTHLLLLSYE